MIKHSLIMKSNIIFLSILLASCSNKSEPKGDVPGLINDSVISSTTNIEPERTILDEKKDTILFYQPLYISDSDKVLNWIAIDSINLLIRDKIGEIKTVSFIPFFSDNNRGYQIYPSKNTYNDFSLKGYFKNFDL